VFLVTSQRKFSVANGRSRRTTLRKCPLEVHPLEGRLLLDGMSLVGQWDNGTALYSDGWGETNYAYIGHYGNNNGMQIIDLSDPTNPTLVSTFLSPSGWNDFRDMETAQQGDRTIAFCSSDTGGGVIVVDVTDRTAPRELYRITVADNGTNTVHTLSVDGDYLYEAYSRTPNIRVFNISDPESPAFVRIIRSDSGGPVHEVTALNGRLYTAVINSSGRSEVYDISNVGDPEAPVPLVASIPSGGYAHTAWPTDDGNVVAVARETFGGDVKLWDISDPSTPVLDSTISLPTTETYSLHQVMILGNLLYISAYEAGVLVYDITDPTAPVQVGSYQTYDGPVNGYAGCWGVYPFLGNDRILAFDMQSGLFVLSLDSMPRPVPRRFGAQAGTQGEQTVAAADLNGGGFPDLTVANNVDGVSILVHDGNRPRPGHPGGGSAAGSTASPPFAGARAAPLTAMVKPADAFFAAAAEPQAARPAWRPRMGIESAEGWGAVFGARRRWADVWEATTGRELPGLEGRQSAMTTLALSQDDTTLASGDHQGSILLWKLPATK
jgi:choice-of-anchor B domain-containing protein